MENPNSITGISQVEDVHKEHQTHLFIGLQCSHTVTLQISFTLVFAKLMKKINFNTFRAAISL